MEYVLTEEDRAEITGKLADHFDGVAAELTDEGHAILATLSDDKTKGIVLMSVSVTANGFQKLAARLREEGL